MTKSKWLREARKNSNKLKSLVSTYHPAMYVTPPPMQITAPAAEMACQNIRSKIQSDERGMQRPDVRLATALKTGDIREIDSLLSSAWFGVPESTDCWEIEGFKEAVDLMDDPPEEGV